MGNGKMCRRGCGYFEREKEGKWKVGERVNRHNNNKHITKSSLTDHLL